MEEILFITTILPFPPDSGAKIKTYNTLYLLSSAYAIDLLAFVNSASDIPHIRDLEKMGIRVDYVLKNVVFNASPFKSLLTVSRSIFGRYPYAVYKYRSKRMGEKIRRKVLAKKYKHIYIDNLPLFQYAAPGALKGSDAAVILDQHNVESDIIKGLLNTTRNVLKRLFLRYDYLKLVRYEKNACMRSDTVLGISPKDCSAFTALTGGKCECFVAPLFVARPESKNYYLEHAHEKTILFLGTISWYPNEDAVLWFYKKVFSDYTLSAQGWKLLIVGHDPGPSVLKLRRDSAVTVTGHVADIKPHIRNAIVSVVPMRIGGGIRIRILELFSLGIPVISTSIGCDGIPVSSGSNILIADSPREFIDAINSVEADEGLRRKLSSNAVTFIENGYSLSAEKKEAYSELIAHSHHKAAAA